MRVLIINTAERIGGAAIAANRLMEALKNNGIKAKMLVRDKQTDQVTVVALKKSWRGVAPQPAHGMEVRMGANRYLESQPFQETQSLCRRHCQYGY